MWLHTQRICVADATMAWYIRIGTDAPVAADKKWLLQAASGRSNVGPH